jgi:MerR family transcriptional regulator, light-induced transcriptional regulator
MRDSQHGGQSERDASGVAVLARTVLARLLGRTVDEGRGPKQELTVALARAVTAADPAELQSLRAELRRQRVSESELVDCYFPAVAQHLGCDWAADRASFAEVSIGMARMQSILHDVSRDWISNHAAQPDSATALILLPEGEQHCFGALLLLAQLRRRGVSVQLLIGARPEEMRAVMQGRNFDCVMISVGCEEKLEIARRLVKAIRAGAGVPVRVAVGGAVLLRPVDVKQRTGADIVTSDPAEALAELDVRLHRADRVAG